MESSYIRYASQSDYKKKDVFTTIQIALAAAATGLGVVLYFAGSPLLTPLLSLDSFPGHDLLGMMLVILWLDTMSIVPYAHLRLVRSAMIYAVIKLVNVIINVGLNLYLIIVLQWGLEAILISNIIASGVSFLMLAVVTSKLYFGRPSSAILYTTLLFGLPYIPNGIGFAINEVIDRFFLNMMDAQTIEAIYGLPYSSEDITGIYNACYKISVFMLLLVQMFRLAWQPFFMRHAKSETAPKLFSQVFFYFNAVSAVLFLIVASFVTEIVSIRIPLLDATIIDSRYWAGLSIVPILLMAYWFQGWFMNFSAGIFIKEKTIWFPKITFWGAGITIVGNLLMVPVLGMMGSALATMLCYGFMCLYTLRLSQSVFQVDYPFKYVILLMSSSLLIVTLTYFLPIVIVSELLTKITLVSAGLLIVVIISLHYYKKEQNLG